MRKEKNPTRCHRIRSWKAGTNYVVYERIICFTRQPNSITTTMPVEKIGCIACVCECDKTTLLKSKIPKCAKCKNRISGNVQLLTYDSLGGWFFFRIQVCKLQPIWKRLGFKQTFLALQKQWVDFSESQACESCFEKLLLKSTKVGCFNFRIR